MFRKTMIALASSAAIAIAGPALAQNQPAASATADVQAQADTKPEAKKSEQKIVRAGPNAGQVINKRHKSKSEEAADAPATQASKSQGPANASATGIANANDNSVPASGAVESSALAGLAANMTVKSSAGAQLGTVTQIITGPNETIRAVVVTSASGQTYTLPANTLTIAGGVVTTSSTSVGG